MRSYLKTTMKISEPVEIENKCYLPARFVLTFFLFLAMALEFAHRVCFSVTIVVMVNHTAFDPPDDDTASNEECPYQEQLNGTEANKQGDYLWSPSIQGLALGAYFYGYVCTQLLGGRLAELFGGKWPLGIAILMGSILTLITPLASDLGVGAIFSVRMAMGMIHGICLPTAFAMLANWSPEEERNTHLALCIVGDHIGLVLTMPIAAFLCEKGFAGGWPSVFYVLGIAGCVWFIFWSFMAYNKPSDHPRITKRELEYIQKGNTQMGSHQKLPIPWRKVLSSMPIWSVIIATFCMTWGQVTLLTKLPTYLDLVLHVPIQQNGFMNSIIYVSSCITMFVAGYASDYLRSRKGYNSTTVRKGFQAIAFLGPAVCTALIPFFKCQEDLVITMLIVSMALSGFNTGGQTSISADMAPHHSATIFGLLNGLGSTAGILSPLVAGLILESAHACLDQWAKVFYLATGIYVVGGLIFLIWASAERQSWASTSSDKESTVSEKKPSMNI